MEPISHWPQAPASANGRGKIFHIFEAVHSSRGRGEDGNAPIVALARYGETTVQPRVFVRASAAKAAVAALIRANCT
jgi:hypothetical protein